MDLLTNAVESIQVGVEDYQTGSRPRLLAAVRNIHAGILLLYKEALVRLSPDGNGDLLIKARVEPTIGADGKVVFVGKGKRTLDVPQIQERFKSLGLSTDWKRFQSITELRNDIEHYYADVTQEALRGVIASAFLIIRKFAKEELEEEPHELLGHETWQRMLAATEVYNAERKECDDAIRAVDWGSGALEEGVSEVRCTDCGSDLLQPVDTSAAAYDVVLQCRSCGEETSAETFIPEALEVSLANDFYLAQDDGTNEPVIECPSCGTLAYVLDEQRCAYCGDELEHECARCGNEIPPSELASSPICGYCEHIMTKND